jgi:hypothetical protein
MKNPFMIGFTGLLILWAGTGTWAGDRFEYRQQRQLRQINDGLRTGQITDREFKQLSKEQERIREFRKKAKKEGYNYRTRSFLDTMQKRADVGIYTARNNGRTIYNRGFNGNITRGRISGTPTYGTALPYGRTSRFAPSDYTRAYAPPSRTTGGISGGYRGSRSGVRASMRW